MKKISLLILFFSINVYSQSLAPAQSIFMQGNNINSVFMTDGFYNFDYVHSQGDAGFIWPATSTQRITAVFGSSIWIGAKIGSQHELRLAASSFVSHFSPGNIPVIGQIPPQSVCNDPSWRGYYIHLNDPSLFNGGLRYKTTGGRQYTFNYDSWAVWPVQKGAPYVEVNGIPGYQPAWNGDRPGIGNGMTARPEELLFMVFMDYTDCTDSIHLNGSSSPGGTKPMGVEIQKLVFTFNCAPLRDMYFIKYKIINKSINVWDSVWISDQHDPDIGDAFDDLNGCDSARNLSFTYNKDNDDGNYGINPPAFGTRILQSPLKYTGNNFDTVKLPYDTITGYKMTGLSGFYSFYQEEGCYGIPSEAIYAYNFMRGKHGCGTNIINWVTNQQTSYMYSGNSCSRIGWIDSFMTDKRNISNMGPVTMNSSDTQIVVLSYMITRDGGNNFQNVCALQSISDSALKYYYNDFRTCVPIGIEPISTEIPQKFELFQNYPNPFNPTTKIRFNIPAFVETTRRVVSLRIYDALGKEIAVLVNQNLKPGIYEIDWNAENIPSGVYFYSLVTNEFTQTKKMVVLK
jgi:hypothetical protein